MSELTLAQTLGRFAADQRSAPTEVSEIGELVHGHVVDVLGNSLAAAASDVSSITRTVIRSWGGTPDSTAIGVDGSFPAPSAALHNGTLAHALDFDDTHLPSVVHPSASVIPAVLAAGERMNLTFRQIAPAIAVGLEITNRLGMAGYDTASNDSVFFDRGLHATSICGCLGAAVAVAMLYGADEAGIAHTIGIASSMGAGLLEANRTGGTVKKAHCGWAAHSGVVAADLARSGLTGPPTVLEGRFGFLQAHCGDRANPNALVDDLGDEWTLGQIGFKPYPCNIYTHSAIDAAMRLRTEGIRGEDLNWVEVGVAAPTLRTIAEPAERKATPATGYEAQFSGPYAFAAALTGGGGLGVYLEDFTDSAIEDATRRSIAAKVRFVADEDSTRAFPRRIPAVVEYQKTDGSKGRIRISHSRGFGNQKLTETELQTKFKLNALRALSPESVDRISAMLPRLAGLSIKQVLRSLRHVASQEPQDAQITRNKKE